jgi:hypothetical protein
MELHRRIDEATVTRDRLTGGSRRPRRSLSQRLRARARANALDRALSQGADPRSDPTLALRAEHLRSPHLRHQLVDGLRDLVARAEHPPRLSSAAPVARIGVLANRDRIEELATRLGSEPAPDAGGIAAINLLITDGTSPLWVCSDGHELRDCLDAALRGLGR